MQEKTFPPFWQRVPRNIKQTNPQSDLSDNLFPPKKMREHDVLRYFIEIGPSVCPSERR